MKKRELGHLTDNVSLLGFGCMRLPQTAKGNIDEAEAFILFDKAYLQGVNYYDTAFPYHNGESEIILGKWLKTKDRSTLFIADKNPVWLLTKHDDFRIYLEQQLTKLQTTYVDYYLLHALDKERFAKLEEVEIFSALDEVKKDGLVHHIGFSFHDDYPTFVKILSSYKWDFCQIQLNYMDINHQAGLKGLRLAEKLGIPVIIMEPVKGGSLARVPSEIRSLFETKHPKASDASWALRWVASQENVLCVLSGMSTRNQVDDNLATFKDFKEMTDEENEIIMKASEYYRTRVQVPCTTCRYCMPCPHGVDIPVNFSYYNDAFIYENPTKSSDRYYNWMDEGERSSACISCGECIPKCPQKIAIFDRMKDVTAYFSEHKPE